MTTDIMMTTSVEATIHPRWVRVCHWINALAILVMIGSGWQIYNALPLFHFLLFPRQIALANWLAGALLWHFAAMWVLVINGLVYVTLGIVTGRFRRKLLPIRPGDVVADMKAALTFKIAHDDLSRYNAVQKLLYTGVILAGVVIVLSGLSIWKPVQFQELTAVFGGYDAARYVHFFSMATSCGFLFCDCDDCRISCRACCAGGGRAEKPARHDLWTIGASHAPAKAYSRRRSEVADQGCGAFDARSQPSRFPARSGEPRSTDIPHRLRRYRWRYRGRC